MKIDLPFPPQGLNPNRNKRSVMMKARLTKEYRKLCGNECFAQGIRRVHAEALNATITFYPPDKRLRDFDNMIASFKSGQDGIADVVGVDDAKWATDYRINRDDTRGRVVVELEAV